MIELTWKRADRCTEGGMNCVEVAAIDQSTVGVRDSKTGKVLTFSRAEWGAFLAGAQQGDFDTI